MVLCQAPGKLSPGEQLALALKACGEDYLWAMFRSELECQNYFGVHLAIQAVHMRLMIDEQLWGRK